MSGASYRQKFSFLKVVEEGTPSLPERFAFSLMLLSFTIKERSKDKRHACFATGQPAFSLRQMVKPFKTAWTTGALADKTFALYSRGGTSISTDFAMMCLGVLRMLSRQGCRRTCSGPSMVGSGNWSRAAKWPDRASPLSPLRICASHSARRRACWRRSAPRPLPCARRSGLRRSEPRSSALRRSVSLTWVNLRSAPPSLASNRFAFVKSA